MSAPDLLSSQITKDQRWSKLYRIIHNLFLHKEFVHVNDYKETIKALNARILAVEVNAQAALSSAVGAIVAMNAAHTHTVTTAGGPTNQAGVTTSVIAAAPELPPTPKSIEALVLDPFMKKEVARLFAEGPALAPLSGSLGSDQLRADTTVRSDILKSEVG